MNYTSRLNQADLASSIAIHLARVNALQIMPSAATDHIQFILAEHVLPPAEENVFQPQEDAKSNKTPYEQLVEDDFLAWSLNRLKALAITGDHWEQIMACEALAKVCVAFANNRNPWGDD